MSEDITKKVYGFDDVTDLLFSVNEHEETFQFYLRQGTDTQIIGTRHELKDLKKAKFNIVNAIVSVIELNHHNLEITNNTHNTIMSEINQFMFDLEKKKSVKKIYKDWDGSPISEDDIITEADSKDDAKLTWKVSSMILKHHKIITFRDNEDSYIYKDGYYLPNADSIIKEETTRILSEGSTRYIVNEVISKVKRRTYKDRSKAEANKFKICLENGILDLSKNDPKFSEHSPDEIFLSKIPVNYDPNATCPTIEKFFKEVFLPEDVLLVEELCGYVLYREYHIHKACMLFGSGRNGKTTFINLLRSFLGEHNVTGVSLQELNTNTFAPAELYKKLANLSDDLHYTSLQNTGVFKKAVGQSPLIAQRKYRDPFLFINYAKMIFACNKFPKSWDKTDAYFRRWVIIRFFSKFDGKHADKKLIDKLTTQDELSGLLNIAIKGLLRLLKNEEFSYPLTIDETRELMNRLADSVDAFSQDMIELDTNSIISKDEFYAFYVDYCNKNKLSPDDKVSLGKKLSKIYGTQISSPRKKVGDKRKRLWQGIKIIGHVQHDDKQKTLEIETPEIEGLPKDIWDFIGNDGSLKSLLMTQLKRKGNDVNAIERVINQMIEQDLISFDKSKQFLSRRAK